MEKNTPKLQIAPMIEASGELIVTGVLVDNLEGFVYFYPDKNLKNVLFDIEQVFNCKSNCGAIKPSANYPIGVLADDKILSKVLGVYMHGTHRKSKSTF